MAKPHVSRFGSLRDAFFSGALLLAPLVVSLWAFSKIIDMVGGSFRPLFFFYLPDRLLNQPSLAVLLDIIATCIVIVLVTLLGYVSREVFGKFFVRVAERFMLSIPGVGAVYVSVKQIVDTFSTQKHQLFSRVVLVEFPRKGASSPTRTRPRPRPRRARASFGPFSSPRPRTPRAATCCCCPPARSSCWRCRSARA